LIFSTLASLPSTSLPPADDPLVPSVEDVQKRMSVQRGRGQGEDSDGSLEIVSPTDAQTPTLNEKEEEEKGEGEKGQRGEGKGSNEEIDRETLYLSIVTSDSTVVYYKNS
jgi:hypothetical protein